MKELKFINVSPIDNYYLFQQHLWLENLKELGFINKASVLLFIPKDRTLDEKWKKLEALYPEASFHYYNDDGTIAPLLPIYIPILRPYCLWKHFEKFPELKNDAIFYYDCDVLLMNSFNLDEYKDNDVCYVSDTRTYLNTDYFYGKSKDVLPQRLEAYKQIDVVEAMCKIVGIDKEIAISNKEHTGGAQYLLKNIDADFWKKMMDDTIDIRKYLLTINRNYFLNENTGHQSWVSDMVSLLYNLWYKGFEVKVIDEMSFAWAPDPISKLTTCSIFHNAGVTGETMHGNVPCFFKGKYVGGSSPFSDIQLDNIMNNEESKKYCTHYYVQKLVELKNKYHLI